MFEINTKIRSFSKRIMILGGIKWVCFGVLMARFFQLQILGYSKYSTMSKNNMLATSKISPLRGIIYDANKNEVAHNIDIYNIVISQYNIDTIKRYIKTINSMTNLSISYSDSQLNRMIHNSYKRYPILLQDNVDWDVISKIEFNLTKLPGIAIQRSIKRHYPYGSALSHVIGYISLPNKRDITNKGLDVYDVLVGKGGIEDTYNSALTGDFGKIVHEVNAHGSIVRISSELPPSSGEKINISIDVRINQFIQKKFKNIKGSVVALDINTGGVIAMYSNPSFDPTIFNCNTSSKGWQDIRLSKDKPLINRAIGMHYPPGSTFKIVTALALLDAGVDPNYKLTCNGEHAVGDRIFRCWKKGGHGTVDMNTAIAQSCNVYFYIMAELAGINRMHRIAKLLGFGSLTGIDVPFEVPGLMPSTEWKDYNIGEAWQSGDTVNTAIGQGYVSVTPIQMAIAVARIASGKVITPSIRERNGIVFDDLAIPQEHCAIVKKGMLNVFNSPYGTGYRNRSRIDEFPISGKTGTAQTAALDVMESKNIMDHGLFVGFAPYHNPKYAIAATGENTSWGSRFALPISRATLIQMYRLHGIV